MTNVVEFDSDIEKPTEDIKENETIFVVGKFSKGEKKGKMIAIKVRNTLMMNPIEPIFEAHPDIDCLVVTKDEKKARKYLKKLFS